MLDSVHITPVINVDPNGKSFLAILGTVAIGAFIGGFFGAVFAVINGDDIFVGFCIGAVAGAIISVGIAMALVLGPVVGGAMYKYFNYIDFLQIMVYNKIKRRK